MIRGPIFEKSYEELRKNLGKSYEVSKIGPQGWKWNGMPYKHFLGPYCHFFSENSGGASAAKKPGHFKVRTSSSQVTGIHFFLKKVDDLFSHRP